MDKNKAQKEVLELIDKILKNRGVWSIYGKAERT